VYHGDLNLTGEGMGIGNVAIRDHEYTYFSRSWTDSTEQGVFKRIFTLDTRMRWSIGGKSSGLLTRLFETGTSIYMLLPRFQRMILVPVVAFSTLLGIKPIFEQITPRGSVTFIYQVTGHQVEVHVAGDLTISPEETVCLLNELSAAWFTAGWDGERKVPPPPGWEKVRLKQLPVSLIDPVHGIRFFFDAPSVSPPVPFTVYQGRECSGDLCWAGFCIELGPVDGSKRFPEVQYCIGFIPEVGL
jgi:hypothetical protein